MATHSGILAWELRGQGSLVVTVHEVAKSQSFHFYSILAYEARVSVCLDPVFSIDSDTEQGLHKYLLSVGTMF